MAAPTNTLDGNNIPVVSTFTRWEMVLLLARERLVFAFFNLIFHSLARAHFVAHNHNECYHIALERSELMSRIFRRRYRSTNPHSSDTCYGMKCRRRRGQRASVQATLKCVRDHRHYFLWISAYACGVLISLTFLRSFSFICLSYGLPLQGLGRQHSLLLLTFFGCFLETFVVFFHLDFIFEFWQAQQRRRIFKQTQNFLFVLWAASLPTFTSIQTFHESDKWSWVGRDLRISRRERKLSGEGPVTSLTDPKFICLILSPMLSASTFHLPFWSH